MNDLNPHTHNLDGRDADSGVCPVLLPLPPGFDLGIEPINPIFAEVAAELARAEAKFPDEHLPDGTGRPGDRHLADAYRAICKANGPAEDNWRDVLAEEVAEAFAETDPVTLRAELVQAAAMAVRWIGDIDRRAEAAA